MTPLQARWRTSRTRHWLDGPPPYRLLHLFADALNLVNGRGELLSVVNERIGSGPFNLVVAGTAPFTGNVQPADPVLVNGDLLQCGSLRIDSRAPDWSAVPDWTIWASAETRRHPELKLLSGIAAGKSAAVLWAEPGRRARQALLQSLTSGDLEKMRAAALQLAGLGPGLTPAGDDYLAGIFYGLHGLDMAGSETAALARAAAAQTTTLAAAWLLAAAAGEAGIVWHHFCAAAAVGDGLLNAGRQLIQIGHSSGADALLGFFDCLDQIGGNS